jgi:hypothetical protein
MLLTILLAALQLAQAPDSPAPAPEIRRLAPPHSPAKDCPRTTLRYAAENGPARPRRLIELPPGRLELAVMRQINGCPIPAVVREGIGGHPARAEKPEPSRR